MKSNLLKQFISQLDKQSSYNLSAQKVLVAVSGGIDSVVLLDLLIKIREIYEFSIHIAHVNHTLRGEESLKDAEFVEKLSINYDIACFSTELETEEFSASKQLSIQEAARILRYRFFEKLRKEHHFDKLATAHNLNDNAETFLINLFRGSGLRGLSGIPNERDWIIRPLLFASRTDIYAYATEQNLLYREDRSNQTNKYLRNRIRNELIPKLIEEYQPNLISILGNTIDFIAEMNNWVKDETREVYNKIVKKEQKKVIILDIVKFRGYLIALKKELLFHIVEKLLGQSPAFNHTEIENLLHSLNNRSSGWTVLTRMGVSIAIDRDELIFWLDEDTAFPQKVKFPGSHRVFELNKTLQGKWADKRSIQFKDKNSFVEYVDFDRLKPPFLIETWHSGDRFMPIGMKTQKKISDFFIDEKIPIYLKSQIPILKDREKIIWICGYRIDERVKISSGTRKILKLELLNTDDKELS